MKVIKERKAERCKLLWFTDPIDVLFPNMFFGFCIDFDVHVSQTHTINSRKLVELKIPHSTKPNNLYSLYFVKYRRAQLRKMFILKKR
jgi:hypothetical protein